MTIINPRIDFYFPAPCRLRERKKLRDFIISLFHKEGRQLKELSLIFCDDPYLLALNREFLDHNYYTDILSFPFSSPRSKVVSGEIYISVERVRANARDLRVSFNQEIHRVIFHGLLHLCRYKDKSGEDRLIMRRKEDQYLAEYFQ